MYRRPVNFFEDLIDVYKIPYNDFSYSSSDGEFANEVIFR